MGQTLTHGIYLPDEGERNCYNGLAANWSILDAAVGTIAEHTTALSGKAPLVHTHTKSDITDFPAYGNTAGTICEGNDSRLSDARTPVAHTHVTADVTDLLNTSHEWTKEQVCDEGFTSKSTTLERCVTPATVKHINFTFKDKNDKGIGAVRRYFRDNGVQQLQVFGNTRIKDGQYDETGSDEFFGFSECIKPDGTKYFVFDGYLNNSIIPLATNTYQLGDSSYQWNNLYAKNYFYNGTAWGLDKANTWSGINTFTAASYGNKIALKNTGLDLSNGNSGLTDTYSHFIRWVDNSDTIYALLQGWTRSLDSVISISNRYKTDANTTVIAELRLENSGTAKAFYSNSNGDTDLGTSAKKWKTLNGVNPGALSLPDYAHPTFLDVTSQGLNWHTDTTPNYYEIPANGYFAVIVQCPNTSNGVLDIFVNNTGIGSSDHGTYAGNELFCCVPVLQGQVVRVRARCDNYYSVAFYPCLGNV